MSILGAMFRLALPLFLLAMCYASLVLYVHESYPLLPTKVASHFDGQGRPNGWMSRDLCVEFTLGLSVLMPGLVIALMAGAGRIPVSFINLPHREYWLAPERRRLALAVLLQYSIWFAAINVLFITGVHWLIVQANLPNHRPHLSGTDLATVVGAFLGSTVLWLVLLVRRFSTIA